jgi:hypothetical protein
LILVFSCCNFLIFLTKEIFVCEIRNNQSQSEDPGRNAGDFFLNSDLNNKKFVTYIKNQAMKTFEERKVILENEVTKQLKKG